jgi:hypothetical protein
MLSSGMQLNELHHSGQEPADIHYLDHRWIRVGDKNGGVTPAGDSGIYQDASNEKRRVLFKHDPVVAKNIAEIIAGKIMRLLNPDAPHLFADVQPTVVYGEKGKDETGKNIFVASVMFNEFKDLYKDAYDAYNRLDRYKKRRNNKERNAKKPTKRPSYFDNDTIVNKMLLSCRYHQLAKLLVTSLFLDDTDVHTENIGVVPAANSSCYGEGKDAVYDRVMPVRIDYGGALGDKRRKLDRDLHLLDFLRYVSLKGEEGPPNYFRTYPKEIFERADFLEESIKLSCFPEEVLSKGIMDIVNEVSSYYADGPLLAFADWIGVVDFMKNERHIRLDEETKRYDLISYIIVFLQVMLTARLQAEEKEALKLAAKLGIHEYEFNWMKKKAKKTFNTIFQLNKEIANVEENMKNSEKKYVENHEDNKKIIDDLTSIFNSTIHLEGNEAIYEHQIELLLELAEIGIISYHELTATQTNGLLSFFSPAPSIEKQSATLASKILSEGLYGLDNKLIALCTILSHNNKLPSLRHHVTNEFVSFLGEDAFHLYDVIKVILINEFKFDDEDLNHKIANSSVLDVLTEAMKPQREKCEYI